MTAKLIPCRWDGQHRPSVARHRDGWAVYCQECSEEYGEYVGHYEGGRRDWPPEILVEPGDQP